jgi:hypothetical protein
LTSEVERYRAVVEDGSRVWPSLAVPVTPGLPLPSLADDLATTDTRLAVTTVDRDGRLADRSPVTYVGWSAGQTVQLHVEPGPVIVVRPGAGIPISRRGHLRLPVSVRRRCRIAVGDRLLVVAHQRPGELLVVGTATVDVLVTTLLRDAGQAVR